MTSGMYQVGDRELLLRILDILERQQPKQPAPEPLRIYDNKAIMQLLGIKDKYLKKLRDNGYLGYSREGDKYWYTQADVERFLRRFHFAPFATDTNLP